MLIDWLIDWFNNVSEFSYKYNQWIQINVEWLIIDWLKNVFEFCRCIITVLPFFEYVNLEFFQLRRKKCD